LMIDTNQSHPEAALEETRRAPTPRAGPQRNSPNPRIGALLKPFLPAVNRQ
jgi:hypothetical protein